MHLDRRKFLGTTAGLVAAPFVLRHARAAEAVSLCGVWPFSGTFASVGKFGDIGMALAVRRHAETLGLAAEYVQVDSEGNPGRAVRKVIEATQQDGMTLFNGAPLSSVALAISKEIDKSGGLLFTAVGADEVTGTGCNKATFRWSVPTYGAIRETVLPLIEEHPNLKRWYTITPQYVFGDALLANAKAVFEEKGLEHVGNSYHSLSEKEFSGYLAEVMAHQPDVLLLLNFGQQSIDALRQAVSFGMKENTKILMAWGAGLEQFTAMGSDLLEGVYIGCQYWHEIDSPGNRKLVDLWKSELGELPGYVAVSGYVGAQLILDAVKRTGGADPKTLVETLEGYTYEGPTGDELIRAGDHQCIKNYYLLRGKPKDKKRYEQDFVDIVSFGKSFIPEAETGCRMS